MEDLERTSGLSSPNILLTGHEGDVYALEFSPDGQFLATGGKDKTILLFQVYGECLNFGVLEGHKNAVLELHWDATGGLLYSCSADHTAAIWDVEYRKRIKNLNGHSEIVNSCYPARKVVGSNMIVTGSDDGTVKIWDTRSKNNAKSIAQDFQILAVCADANGERVFSGGIDNVIRVS
ncbi:U5 small nuclear ribonucleoprotein subunit, putative [Theileria equi strain WA]|uniref:U5 small nuclear ribonucleoprotein subunit, putative n=1 Tax=Theileria equi strain WA TaxID=1537102 RepID=L0B156_THEEQ|nr:U5 small nuclear ribonucleoprotein subunit, putative [Theileria equi strain WA]AFZ80966.1 U5 small nuclear ribonucleoprotein subunit, putative [Theileria equi strain WA]|eukprot:XP_004830632.1 U5 small nuclear ribonucleoprotein subunit, putative [Theileria equi strain WA]